jgi:RsiW-degrading membrane proteinase PrsW (M82 family)
MLIVGGFVAILLPLLFLYIIYTFDLYSSSSFGTVLVCFGWGLVAFGFALALNTGIAELVLKGSLGMEPAMAVTLSVVMVAPVVEEVLKSLSLVYSARRPEFTYFVDGAIYGFAVGIGFSILENLWYLFHHGNAGQGLLLPVSRSFSAVLMHGTASALVGIAVGRFRYGRGPTRVLTTLLGWGAAIALHSAFNYIIEFWEGPDLLLGAVGLGVGGVILVVLFIRWGLAEEKKWIEETLGVGLRVTQTEKALVRELHDLEDFLQPIQERFGKKKTGQVEAFLLKQAQLGIKQKSSEKVADPHLRAQIQDQIQELQLEIDNLRRQVGVYCMTYVRSIFPPDFVNQLWFDLEQRVGESRQRQPQFDLWGKLASEAATAMDPEPGNPDGHG